MVKRLTLLASFFYAVAAYAQYDIVQQYRVADSLMHADNYADAYKILRRIEPVSNKKDTSLYPHILWDYTIAVSLLEAENRQKENWKYSVSYALEALSVIKKGKEYFDEDYPAREYWMYKNIIVAFFGLGYPGKAKEYQDKLYEAYRLKILPDGLDEYYNIEFFKWNGQNVWGYEWYPQPGDPETKGIYSKIVYYVYSTNPDGSDKDQLYRIHVQTTPGSTQYDYVLNKQLETATNQVSGILKAYTYKAPINYTKLGADIRLVLKGIYEPVKVAPPVKKKK